MHEAALVAGSHERRAHVALQLVPYLLDSGERQALSGILEESLPGLDPDDWRRARILVQLAQLANQREGWDEALELLSRSEEEISDQDPDPATLRTEILGIRGDVFLHMGVFDRAAHWLDREREAVALLPTPSLQVRGALATHEANLWLATEGWEALVRDLEIVFAREDGFRAWPQKRHELLVRLAVGLSSLELEDPTRERRAESVFLEVLLADPPPREHEGWNCRVWLTRLLLDQGRLSEAEDRLRSLHLTLAEREASSEGTRSILETAHVASLEARYLRRVGAPREALFLSRDRLLAILDLLLAELASVAPRRGGIGYLATVRVRGLLSELVHLETELGAGAEGAARALDLLLRAQELGTLFRGIGVAGLDAASLQRSLLGPGEGLLFYLPAREASHVFALDRDEVVHEVLPGRFRIEKARRRLVDLVVTPPAGLSAEEQGLREEKIGNASRDLTSLLMPARIVARVRSWSEVTVVAPELLGYLPFECLVLEGEGPLGLVRALGYAPSAPALAGLLGKWRQRTIPPDDGRTRDWVLLADPERDPAREDDRARALVRLPFGERERLLLSAGHEDRVAILRGERARLSCLTPEVLSSARVLEMLVHGVVMPGEEIPAALLLAPEPGARDGLVRVDRLGDLDLVPDLVVLLACGGGRGPLRWGDAGAAQASGVLLGKGASAVILAYADLAHDATVELAGHLHRFLRQGLGAAEALRRARCELVDGGRHVDPFFHSLVHVEGIPHVVIFSGGTAERDKGHSRALLFSVLGLLALGGAGWALQARRRAR